MLSKSVRRVKVSKKRVAHRPSRKAPHQKRNGKAMRRKRRKRFRSDKPGTCMIRGGTIVWTLPRKLQSLNKLRSWRARHGDTKGWERDIDAADILFNDMSLGPGSGQRLRLEVVRLAPNERFKLDKVNLFGGIKGLEDALVRLNFLVDDSEIWEDGPWPSQGVSPDKKYWTIVRLMPCQPEPSIIGSVSSMADAKD